jgi:hypothetical protein
MPGGEDGGPHVRADGGPGGDERLLTACVPPCRNVLPPGIGKHKEGESCQGWPPAGPCHPEKAPNRRAQCALCVNPPVAVSHAHPCAMRKLFFDWF